MLFNFESKITNLDYLEGARFAIEKACSFAVENNLIQIFEDDLFYYVKDNYSSEFLQGFMDVVYSYKIEYNNYINYLRGQIDRKLMKNKRMPRLKKLVEDGFDLNYVKGLMDRPYKTDIHLLFDREQTLNANFNDSEIDAYYSDGEVVTCDDYSYLTEHDLLDHNKTYYFVRTKKKS